nr:RHS repeat-associated core domain-containing protein [Kitasatospora fiedleri]
MTTTVSGGLGTAVPAVTTTYDPATGAVTKQTSTGGGTITKAYDALGRLISYTDADGATTTTEYDALNRPTKVTDSVPSTTTYTYDTAIDPRGLTTSVTDSVAGTFTARYDADGTAVTQGMPGGYTLTDRRDPSGTTVGRSYTRDSDGTVLVSDGITETVQGQWATHTGTPGVTAAQTFAYDKAGRLTTVQDTSPDAVCTTRGYGFDNNTNRTTLATAVAARGTDCTTTGATTQTNTHDSADRLVNSGHTYDAFGRTTALPGSTVAYYTSDLVQQQTTGTNRQTWTLDSHQRFRSWTAETNNSGTWTTNLTKTNHYGSDSDNPRWVGDNLANYTRNVTGITGDLGATTTNTGLTTLQLANLHGDITLQLPLNGTAPTVLDYDEYGNGRTGQTTTRYGWLGTKQRSTETPSGLTLMGVRLYSPTTGRFLSIDPVHGGNANAYDYVHADPLTKYDLDGRWCLVRNKGGGCWGATTWKNNKQTIITGVATTVVTGGCLIATGGAGSAACLWAGGAVGGAIGYRYGVDENRTWRGYAAASTVNAVLTRYGGGSAKNVWSRWVSPFFRGPGLHRGRWGF